MDGSVGQYCWSCLRIAGSPACKSAIGWQFRKELKILEENLTLISLFRVYDLGTIKKTLSKGEGVGAAEQN